MFKDDLINNGYIKPKEIKLSNGRIILFELTERARSFLEKTGYRVFADRNGMEHKYWKWKIADYYRERGYKVFVEEKVNGNVDLAIKKGNVSIAVEIETGTSDFINNIKKDLKAGFNLIISVAVNEIVRAKIEEQLVQNKLNHIKRIKVTTVRAFEN